MRLAYFDCFAGASGDMILGALLDAGLDIERLTRDLGRLHLSHYEVRQEKVTRRGLGGTQAVVTVDQDHHDAHRRTLATIEDILAESDLDEAVRLRSSAVFRRLAEAEARVHRIPVEEVHFHEVGAIDAIIDVVGAVAGLHAMGVETVHCSPLHVGAGTVTCAHGVLPVPAPATAELIKGKPAYASEVHGELLTPTGAAILTSLAGSFGPMPAMRVESVGYGAGTRDLPVPNLLRVLIGESDEAASAYDLEQVAVLETNIDDMNPQIYDHLMRTALDIGALDVFLTPAQMKKNRPGTLVTVVCHKDAVTRFSDLLMRETTTIGVRFRLEQRWKARRLEREARTPDGTVRYKAVEVGGRMIGGAPEYEDCKRLASERGVPLKDVMERARAAILEASEPCAADPGEQAAPPE